LADVPNLFARLHRWATRQDENFLTESLAVVLEHLLTLVPEVGARLISRLTGGFIDVLPDDASSVEIRTQVEAGQGRPDLEIRTPHRLVWVEVKAEAELRTGQLEGYRVLLRGAGLVQTRLVLLTRYPEEFSSDDARPDLAVRWFELADWVEIELRSLGGGTNIAAFLARHFLDFLRVRGMTLTQVGKYMPEGLRALGNLLNMLTEAATACKVAVRKSTGWDQIGLALDAPKYWVGIDLTDPEKLWFRTYCRIDAQAATQLGVGELAQDSRVPGRSYWRHGVQLDSEDIHFYSRTKVSQMEWLEEFVRDCLAKARSIELPDTLTGPEQQPGD
jgi:hypothetical protein